MPLRYATLLVSLLLSMLRCEINPEILDSRREGGAHVETCRKLISSRVFLQGEDVIKLPLGTLSLPTSYLLLEILQI